MVMLKTHLTVMLKPNALPLLMVLLVILAPLPHALLLSSSQGIFTYLSSRGVISIHWHGKALVPRTKCEMYNQHCLTLGSVLSLQMVQDTSKCFSLGSPLLRKKKYLDFEYNIPYWVSLITIYMKIWAMAFLTFKDSCSPPFINLGKISQPSTSNC